jgi:hypothetical protein
MNINGWWFRVVGEASGARPGFSGACIVGA